MVLYNSKNQVFVAKRSVIKDFGAGLWEFPSGRLEDGESLKDAIEREALEEMQIRITGWELFDAYTFERGKVSLALLSYLCTYEGKIILSEEHDEGKWVSMQDAIDLFHFERQKESVQILLNKMHSDKDLNFQL